MMLRALVLLLGASVVEAETVDYTSVLGDLWAQSDNNEDGFLQQAELLKAMNKMGITSSMFTLHSQSLTSFFLDIDTDASGGLTMEELSQAADDHPQYKDDLISGFTNGAGEVPEEIPTPTEAMAQSEATVSLSFQIVGSPSSIYAGQRLEIQHYFADLAGVPIDQVVITFVAATAARARERALQSNELTQVEAVIFVVNEEAADMAFTSLQAADLSDDAFEDLQVVPGSLAVEQPDILVEEMPTTNLAIAAVAMFFTLLFLCTNASYWSGRIARAKRAAGDKTPQGCCSSGCCSFNAVTSWAFGEFVAALLILGTVAFLYTKITPFTDAITGMLTTLLDFRESGNTLMDSFMSMVPEVFFTTLKEQIDHLKNLPVYCMVPGLLAVASLLLASLCPLPKKMNKGSYCCTKFAVMLANVLMILSFVCYFLFAAFSIIFMHVEGAKKAVGEIRGLCYTVPAMLTQSVDTNQQVLTKLADAGQDVAEMQDALREFAEFDEFVSKMCGYVDDLIGELLSLFFPGVLTCLAIMFGLWINQTLCCAAGCCTGPGGKKPKKKAATQQQAQQEDTLQAV